jgi:hypothetical protein
VPQPAADLCGGGGHAGITGPVLAARTRPVFAISARPWMPVRARAPTATDAKYIGWGQKRVVATYPCGNTGRRHAGGVTTYAVTAINPVTGAATTTTLPGYPIGTVMIGPDGTAYQTVQTSDPNIGTTTTVVVVGT